MPFGDQPVKGTKSATLSVGASDTQDAAGCDYICDGTCDEVEINAAIAALPAAGGLVYLCEGTYNVCGPITIDKDNVTIIGAGASTVIRVRDGHNANINIIEATNHSHVLIKDLRIDGNSPNQAAGVLINGIYFNTVTYSKTESCWITGSRPITVPGPAADMTGIYFQTVTHSEVVNCDTADFYGAAAGPPGSAPITALDSDYNTFIGNTCRGGEFTRGINLWHSEHNTVKGNILDSVDNEGIYLNDSHYNTIDGNVCRGVHHGIYLTIASCNNTITGNTCWDGDGDGIQLYNGSNYNVVSGNVCRLNSDHGIHLERIGTTGCDHNVIIGNVCTEQGDCGINLEYSDYNAITGNACQENDHHGITLDNSHNNTIADNEVVNNGLDADITYDGIILGDSDYNSIQGNTVRTTVAAPPPNRQRYGINIGNAACDENLVANNDLYQSGQTAGYNDAGTDTRGTVTGEVSPTGNTLVVAASDSLDPVRADFYCDGTADQTEINAAITALGATGGTVKLLEGTFTVDGTITLASNVALVGQGAGTVITIPDGHDADINIIYANAKTRVLVKDLRVDGNRANQTAGIMEGIYFDTVTHSKVESCWVEDMRNRGIFLIYSDYNTLGCTAEGNGSTGISLADCNYNNIQGNTITGGAGVGIICSDGSLGNIISENTIQGNDQHGISTDVDCNDNTIADNTIINNGLGADATYDGIVVSDNSDYNNIQGNTIRTTTAAPLPNRQRYGINIANATCDGNLVKNNDLHQSGQTAAFQDLGTGTRLPSIEAPIFFDGDLAASLSVIGDHASIAMADDEDCLVPFNFRVPDDFHQLVRARVVVVPLGTGDLRWHCVTDWGACGEAYNNSTGAIAVHTEAVTANEIECLDINAALDGIAAGDHVGVTFARDGAHADDTVDAVVHLLQFWMQYV